MLRILDHLKIFSTDAPRTKTFAKYYPQSIVGDTSIKPELNLDPGSSNWKAESLKCFQVPVGNLCKMHYLNNYLVKYQAHGYT